MTRQHPETKCYCEQCRDTDPDHFYRRSNTLCKACTIKRVNSGRNGRAYLGAEHREFCTQTARDLISRRWV